MNSPQVYPLAFSTENSSAGAAGYLVEPLVRRLLEFFERKGLAALKEEDRGEAWYEDFLVYQARHGLYARLLTPTEFGKGGGGLDLLRLTRFLEVFAYCSPAHGYSLQVTFLGLFAILMGGNAGLKREAAELLEAGGVLAFGVSEKEHGADLLANEFTIRGTGEGKYVANGSKFYIGNANCAGMIAILARREEAGREGAGSRRAPMALFVLRPKLAAGYGNVRKIRTLGIRAAFVGSFEVKEQAVGEADIVAEGRGAWDAIFGTVTLGKFFLGFGSIGICERALAEAVGHLRGRVLYHKAAIGMPHLRGAVGAAYARLMGMKLYAYRALDYFLEASEEDRRYLLFAAVQKAKVSTEGVKVMGILGDCIGAKAFEGETFFEMALRDIQLIPNLEGSAHINLGVAGQFVERYLLKGEGAMGGPGSRLAGEGAGGENGYLFRGKSTALQTIGFGDPLAAYAGLGEVGNVQVFAGQVRGLRGFLRETGKGLMGDGAMAIPLGALFAVVVYGQLIAEQAGALGLPAGVVSAVFHGVVADFSAGVMGLAGASGIDAEQRGQLEKIVAVPVTGAADWEGIFAEVGI